MFSIRVLQADYGDCLILEYSDGGATRYALIDGGPDATYNYSLRSELERISNTGGTLDFVAISHVDEDHITGVLELFAELEAQHAENQNPLIGVEGIWHNSFGQTIDSNGGTIRSRFNAVMSNAVGASAMFHSTAALQGIGQGNQLRIKAQQLGIHINADFPDDLIITDTAPVWQRANLTIRFVGPSRKNLDQLRQEWEDWLDRNEAAIASGDLRVLANSDRSIPNLSSLMWLAEADGRTALFTGDGRSDHLLDGLANAGLLDAQGKMHVDVFKVPHHGSDRNGTKTFFRKVTAEIYVISANGNPDNPDLSTLIWIVEAAKDQGRSIQLLFTNETPSVQKLRAEYPPDTYGYLIEIMPADLRSRDIVLS